MNKLRSLLKIFLIIASLNFLGCAKDAPAFPAWTPARIFPNTDRYIRCKLINPETLEVECQNNYEKFSDADFHGAMCSSINQQADILDWGRKMIKLVKEGKQRLDKCEATVKLMGEKLGHRTNR